jgi:Ca2+-binding EF-hand superfamily protein
MQLAVHLSATSTDADCKSVWCLLIFTTSLHGHLFRRKERKQDVSPQMGKNNRSATAFIENLTTKEMTEFKELFNSFDKDCSGALSIYELKAVMNAVSSGTLFAEQVMMILADVEPESPDCFTYEEFLDMMRIYKKQYRGIEQDDETLAAFVALGGNKDRTGSISTEKMKEVVRELGLTIDIEQLILEADEDGSGFVDFDELSAMLSQ